MISLSLDRGVLQISTLSRAIEAASEDNVADGAAAIDGRVRDDALGFLTDLTSMGLLSVFPDVGIGEDGSLGLLFRNAEKYIYIDVTADNRLHYYARIGDQVITEAVQMRAIGYRIVEQLLGPMLMTPLPEAIDLLIGLSEAYLEFPPGFAAEENFQLYPIQRSLQFDDGRPLALCSSSN